MKKVFYILPFFLLGCVNPSAFMGNGIFSLGASQSLGKAAISSGTDYVIKKETGKNSLQHICSFFASPKHMLCTGLCIKK